MSDPAESSTVRDPARLEALRRTDLLDTPPEDEFDRLTALAARLLGAPMAMVSLVDADRQFFKSAVGLAEPWRSARQSGLDRSVCQHVVNAGAPVAIADTRADPLVRESPRIADSGMLAYAGVPIVTAEGHTLGSFCVLDAQPREWNPQEMQLLAELAASATALIERRPPDARPARSDVEGVLEAGDRLWEATDRYLTALADYDGLVERLRAGRGRLEEERDARGRVDGCERAFLAATDALGARAERLRDLAPPLQSSARALWLAALYYVERVGYRRAASARFQQEGGALEEVERAVLLVRSAHAELEHAAAAYRHARIERRARPR